MRPESSINLAGHDLEADLAESPAWISYPICDRMISLGVLNAPGGDYFSMQTKFAWKADEFEGQQLATERNLPGTLYALQLWRRSDGPSVFRCKPLAGSNLVDLLGQTRTTERTQMYFATDTQVLVRTEGDKLLVFDDEGYIKHVPEKSCLNEYHQVWRESQQSWMYGKFFLLSKTV